MVQVFQVLKCFSCQTFQVHQVKKSKTWTCKLCGEKQSLLKVYGQGSGPDCRHHVQKLNLLQGEARQEADYAASLDRQQENSDNEHEDVPDGTQRLQESGASVSRWKKYIEENSEEIVTRDEQENEEESLVYTDRQQFYSQQKKQVSSRKRKKMHHEGQDCHQVRETPYQGSTENVKRSNYEYLQTVPNIKKPGLQEPLSIKPEDMGTSPFHGILQHTTLVTQKPSCTESKWGRFLYPSTADQDCEDDNVNRADKWKSYSPRLSMDSRKNSGHQEFDINQDPKYAIHTDTPLAEIKISKEGTALDESFSMFTQKDISRVWKTCADQNYLASSAMELSDRDPVLNASIAALSSKPFVHPVLFQTDEDFDDNY